MQTYDNPNTAFEVFKNELSQRKKTPKQIISKYIKDGIITQPIADQLVQLAEYRTLVEEWDGVTASLAWTLLTERAAHSPITA